MISQSFIWHHSSAFKPFKRHKMQKRTGVLCCDAPRTNICQEDPDKKKICIYILIEAFQINEDMHHKAKHNLQVLSCSATVHGVNSYQAKLVSIRSPSCQIYANDICFQLPFRCSVSLVTYHFKFFEHLVKSKQFHVFVRGNKYCFSCTHRLLTSCCLTFTGTLNLEIYQTAFNLAT